MTEPVAPLPVSPRSPLGAWAAHHVASIGHALRHVVSRPLAALLTVAALALALALPLGLALVVGNLERLAGQVQQAREIALYLKPAIPEAEAAALAARLRQRADVAAVRVRTPAEGLAALDARGGDFAAAAQALGENPLPSLLIVQPKGDETALAEALAALPEADQVQRDAAWRARLDAWLRFGHRLVWTLAVLFGLGALLVVGNTVRLDIHARREDVAVLQLLGATDGFIRRPFLYLGALYGLLAGAMALAALTAMAFALAPAVDTLAASYGGHFALAGLPPPAALAVLGASALLGWIGAVLAVAAALRHTRPARA
jgi:cell division transport system permease protein